jgi:hypothetical protein
MTKGKDEMRRQLASLSFTEKIKILEKLRDRSLGLAAVGPRQKRVSEQPTVRRETSANRKEE